jgi:ATP-dependent Clp protease adaptor protein ClpS
MASYVSMTLFCLLSCAALFPNPFRFRETKPLTRVLSSALFLPSTQGAVFLCIMAYPATRPQTDYQDDVLLLEEELELRTLVVYNDDVNTFEHVIQTLIDVCDHEPEQAEQCTLLIHHKGKCAVKNGTFDELAPRCTAIHDRGISADIV